MNETINERVFLEILDWNLKLVQCCDNIQLLIYDKKQEDKESLLRPFKIKRPKRASIAKQVPLIATEKAHEIVNEIGNNLLAIHIFEKNIEEINQALIRFNDEMKKIHESSTITQEERDFIHTTANILKQMLPKFLENKSKNYGMTIAKVNETLNSLSTEISKENLVYQKEFSEYLVNCFNYISNAVQQMNHRIDLFFNKKDYLKKKHKK
jgi:cell division protein ZapA (FtsZ GTPase activity inhibitor)